MSLVKSISSRKSPGCTATTSSPTRSDRFDRGRFQMTHTGSRAPADLADPRAEEFERRASFDRWDVKSLALDLARGAFPGDPVSLRPAGPGETYAPSLSADWHIIRLDQIVGAVGRVPLDAPV